MNVTMAVAGMDRPRESPRALVQLLQDWTGEAVTPPVVVTTDGTG